MHQVLLLWKVLIGNLYSKNGDTGAGVDANLLPWVEQWDSNKTLIDGEYVVSPKMFSGTKVNRGQADRHSTRKRLHYH